MAYEPEFEPFPGTDAETFIQWKGTDVCLDFYCPCGQHSHYDGDFAYYVRCPTCWGAFMLGTQVRVMRVDPDEAEGDGRVRDLKVLGD